jgi:nucleoside-diphosphate-sugar epimerase
MIKLSDYVIQRLTGWGVRHIFMVTGGGAMHLNDSIGKAERIRYICTQRRSYPYTAVLAISLRTILAVGESGRVYNIGSEESISIRELAEPAAKTVASLTSVHVASQAPPGAIPSRHVPSTGRARGDLELALHVPLGEAIRPTAAWHPGQPSESAAPHSGPRKVAHVSN